MASLREFSKADGSRRVDFFEVSEWSDGMTKLVVPQNLNAANHMRRTEGGAFPLPSAVDLPLLPITHHQECEELRQNAIEPLSDGRDRQNCKQDIRYSATSGKPNSRRACHRARDRPG
jgi:hypothetical protein